MIMSQPASVQILAAESLVFISLPSSRVIHGLHVLLQDVDKFFFAVAGLKELRLCPY